MYGYMLQNKKFYELGEIRLFNDAASGYEWTYACPSEAVRVYQRTWIMSTKEGEVYKCRTVWLAKDDPEKAKALIAKALKDRYDQEVKSATLKYEKALSYLN